MLACLWSPRTRALSPLSLAAASPPPPRKKRRKNNPKNTAPSLKKGTRSVPSPDTSPVSTHGSRRALAMSDPSRSLRRSTLPGCSHACCGGTSRATTAAGGRGRAASAARRARCRRQRARAAAGTQLGLEAALQGRPLQGREQRLPRQRTRLPRRRRRCRRPRAAAAEACCRGATAATTRARRHQRRRWRCRHPPRPTPPPRRPATTAA